MIRFVVARLVQAAIVLAVMSFVVYALIGLMPGDPIDMMISADPSLTSEDVARLKALHGLDRPLVERYLVWAGDALQGNFGFSRLYSRPVPEVLAAPLGRTVLLMGLAFLLSVAIAIPAGLVAGSRPGTTTDAVINFLSFAGISLPSFWLALLLLLLFSVHLGVLPATAMPADADASLGTWLRHMILPVVTLALLSAGAITRYMRAATREAMRQDFVRTARAKGLGHTGVLVRHVLRNAMIPVVTILALDVGALFSGALVTEIMFGWPGMGKLTYDAVMGNDYNLALVALLFSTAVTLAANVMADVAYAAIDPRIAFTRKERT